jgi:hypothetical protein
VGKQRAALAGGDWLTVLYLPFPLCNFGTVAWLWLEFLMKMLWMELSGAAAWLNPRSAAPCVSVLFVNSLSALF